MIALALLTTFAACITVPPASEFQTEDVAPDVDAAAEAGNDLAVVADSTNEITPDTIAQDVIDTVQDVTPDVTTDVVDAHPDEVLGDLGSETLEFDSGPDQADDATTTVDVTPDTNPCPSSCEDGDPCTVDSCGDTGCQHTPGTGAVCDDENPCTLGDACLDGGCAPGKPKDCEPDDPCLVGKCNQLTGKCKLTEAVGGAVCDDGSACTSDDVCSSGFCQGAPITCNDDNPCTADGCDAGSGCTNTGLSGKLCNDDNPCTLADTCVSGTCTGGTPKTCVSPDPCIASKCDPVQGKCKLSNIADGGDCTDGSACTSGDVCQGGSCTGLGVTCDDSNDCTIDSCDNAAGCVTAHSTAACSDGDPCTPGDKCQAGACVGQVASVAVLCDDDNVCTADACVAGTGCEHTVSTSPCDDGNPCTTGDVCSAGTCESGENSCTCLTTADCDAKNDANPCNGTLYCNTDLATPLCQVLGSTVVVCDQTGGSLCLANRCDPISGVCLWKSSLDGKLCDADGSVCTQGDSCVGGGCQAGDLIGCDDHNGCTTDVCSPTEGCLHNANTFACNADANACTENDTCKDKVCLPGQKKVCDDGKVCTFDSCDLKSGACTFDSETLTGTACDADGSACTGGDACQDGLCMAGAILACGDGNACTNDGCDAKLGCVSTHNTQTCDDANACTGGDACAQGVCAGAAKNVEVACDDGNPCTTEACDAKLGCLHSANSATCDDGNPCTAGDVCADSGCQSGANVCACATDNDCKDKDDGNLCNGTLVCDTGKAPFGCKVDPTTVVHCEASGDTVCQQNTCAPGSGTCSPLAAQDGKPCEDGSLCTSGDGCKSGQCTAGKSAVCDDKNACTSDACLPASGCSFTATTLACSDGNACTAGDGCTGGVCVPGSAADCDDGKVCTVDSCDQVKGCVQTATEGSCSDGSACTVGDSCVAGACAPGTAAKCDDGDACTTDSCDAGKGCVHGFSTAACDDGNACTKVDTCQAGTCVGANTVTCTASDQCHDLGTCNAATGTCSNPAKVSGAVCIDGNACTQTDTCQGGKCVGVSLVVCVPSDQCHVAGTCDNGTGACSNPLKPGGSACSDGDVCTVGDVCQAGACAAGAAPNCDDGNACTVDSCDPKVGCTYVDSTAGCDDGKICTGNDKCANKVCMGTSLSGSACGIDALCVMGTCQENACLTEIAGASFQIPDYNPTGSFGTAAVGDLGIAYAVQAHVKLTNSNVGAVAVKLIGPDGGEFTLYDKSATGSSLDVTYPWPSAVVAGDLVKWAGKNPKGNWSLQVIDSQFLNNSYDGQVDAWSVGVWTACAVASVCAGQADGSSCSDGNACTNTDKCQAGECGGAPVNCDDANACTVDVCVPASGCSHVLTAVPVTEQCNGIDDNCSGVTDEGCDDDGDNYCDSGMSVSVPFPAICPNGGNDCDDENPDTHPGNQEVCGNGVDDNCNGSQNDQDALQCTNFYFDSDKDGYGIAFSKCLCQVAGSYTASASGDCDDANIAVNPGTFEKCNNIDDNCNAGGSTVATPDITVTTTNNNDNTPANWTAQTFVAGQTGKLKTLTIQLHTTGTGSCAGSGTTACTNLVDLFIFDKLPLTSANPAPVQLGAKVQATVQTAKSEAAGTWTMVSFDVGTATTVNLVSGTTYAFVLHVVAPQGSPNVRNPTVNAYPNGSSYSTGSPSGTNPVGTYTSFGSGASDRDIAFTTIVDVTSAGVTVDEGCDDDGDDYCETSMTVSAPLPAVCPNGGGDCDDGKFDVNPGGLEACGNVIDEDCDGDLNEENALLCMNFYFDGDQDLYGISSSRCLCQASGAYTAASSGDCNDADPAINPLGKEICDDTDNNCTSTTDEGCDDDGDGYCDAAMITVGLPAVCPKGGLDCADTTASINPGATEVCDDTDNNCVNSTDEGCDDDNDNYCDLAMTRVGTPATCTSGGGDCDDEKSAANPSGTEVCGNIIDEDCDGDLNDVNAVMCTNFYRDNDTDGYGSGVPECLCAAGGAYTASSSGDCNDNDPTIKPTATEVCDNKDNNCSSTVDEGCDDDNDNYCDVAMTTVGTPATCSLGGGDCNDEAVSITPSKAEICDDIDNNCSGGIDEGCDDDGDGYCDQTMTVTGTPAACVMGGSDCNDFSVAVHPGAIETCNGVDDNCNATKDEGASAVCNDGDACNGSETCSGGSCQPGAAINCDDANVCTDDSCDMAVGCKHNTATTGTLCAAGKVCLSSVCITTPVPPSGMVWIPGGTFWMGCNAAMDSNCQSDESPQHKVTLSSYYLDLTETTVAQYRACVDASACTAPGTVQPIQYATYPGLTSNPVNFVTWDQARAFCQWRGTGFDLPTEAQWEMAARGRCEENGKVASDATCAQAMRTFPWGEATPDCSYAVFSSGGYGCGTESTWAVASKIGGKSPFGVSDLAGNVLEWTRDWYDTYPSTAANNPTGPGAGVVRILRGGDFASSAVNELRASRRSGVGPVNATFLYGVRCAKSYP